MPTKSQRTDKPTLDARTFQLKLDELTTTLAFKVQRKGAQQGLRPLFLVADIYFLVRQAQHTYNLFFFVNADKRRFDDTDWRAAYFAVMLPLVRSMIDCFYNITTLFQDPAVNGSLFRSSGYRLTLEALEPDEARYAGDPKWQWDDWIARQRKDLELDMRVNGFNEAEVRAARKLRPTLSGYLRDSQGMPPTAHQEFLKKPTLGFWQEYSDVSHGTFQGLRPVALFLAPKDLPHEDRPKLDDASETLIAIHLPRLADILLCALTELQAYFRFDGARINVRLHEIWNALITAPEVKELYEGRYEKRMNDRGIRPE
jgi:hypothetical protein